MKLKHRQVNRDRWVARFGGETLIAERAGPGCWWSSYEGLGWGTYHDTLYGARRANEARVRRTVGRP